MQQAIIFALLSMLFAGFTSVIAKMGLKNVSGDAALVVRTVFVMAVVLANAALFRQFKELKALTISDITFIGISGFTAAMSWIFFYKAIKIGDVSQIILIDKASILITLVLSFLILKEPMTLKTLLGGGLILSGLLVLTLK